MFLCIVMYIWRARRSSVEYKNLKNTTKILRPEKAIQSTSPCLYPVADPGVRPRWHRYKTHEMGKTRLRELLPLFTIYNTFIPRGVCTAVNIYGPVFSLVLAKIFKIYDDGYLSSIKTAK